MIKWFNSFSGKQKSVFLFSILLSFLIITAGYLLAPRTNDIKYSELSYEKPIRHNAEVLGVTGQNLAKELSLDISVSKTTPIKELNVSEDKFKHAVDHILGHKDTGIKYYIYFSVFLSGFIYLIYLGKPEKAENKSVLYPLGVYSIILIISLIFSGFIFGKSPNPMEGIVKVFKTMVGLYPDPLNKSAAFIFFILLAVIGNKIICGWACPFGALQELLYSMPLFKKIKKIKMPFIISNSIRFLLFAAMLLFLFGLIGNKKGLVIYHYVNPFNLFNFDFAYFSVAVTISLSILLGLFFYRPYCSLICPFGFVSWIFERVSIFRVRINHNLCTKCGACIKACPTTATKGLVENKKIYADCFSCTRCLKVCPVNAIEYKSITNSNYKL